MKPHFFNSHPMDGDIREIRDGDPCGEKAPTLMQKMGVGGQKVPLVLKTYVIDSTASNSMKSGNPNSGVHEVDKAPTLDTTDPSPTKNQGGLMIVHMDQGGAGLLSCAEGGREKSPRGQTECWFATT